MALIISVLVISAVVSVLQVPWARHPADLGRMSEGWLAAHRAAHSA